MTRTRGTGGLCYVALLALLALSALGSASTAAADTADETALAERYAPVVRLVEQVEECGPGEAYEPMDVDALFDEPTVALRGPWGGGDLVKIAPSARALGGGLYEYHLDFPGDALDPGCDFELWARRVTSGREPSVYAHVATDPGHPGQLALQYWLFYAFNDWNNLHEGDWEMVQLIFGAADARAALSVDPTRIGYSQHEGAEGADWDEERLEKVDGTHPVVYPAAGSHANFYESALFLGASGSQGVGCDNTSGPSVELRPTVHTIPSDAAEARVAFPWIEFEGRWGELQPAFYNGPTGPNLKGSWTEPIEWAEGWRGRSYAVPAGGVLGTRTTDFFCDAIANGSRALHRAVDNPLPAFVLLAALVSLAIWGLAQATWRPGTPLRIARRRAWGQILTAAIRSYRARAPLFLGIGLVLVPLSLLAGALQTLVVGASRTVGIETGGESGGFLVLLVLAIGTTLTLFGLGLVQAATAQALVAIDEGREIGPIGAYRLAAARVRPLLRALAICVVIVSLLASSLVLVPLAIWLTVRWALIVPVVQLEGASAAQAMRRSARLVRGNWLKVGSLIVVGAGLALLAAPLLGALLIVVTSTPLWLLNLAAAFVYAVTMPLVALATVYVYFDVRVRDELNAGGPDVLPAEIAIGRPPA